MSRLARKPIDVPKGVSVSLQDSLLKATKGSVSAEYHIPRSVNVVLENDQISCVLMSDDKDSKAMLGTTHVNIANLIKGLTEEFTVDLQLVGIGYNVSMEGQALLFNLGKSHSDRFEIPADLKVSIPEKNLIRLSGISKAYVTHIADCIVNLRKPDAYKGKGIRYKDRAYRLKEVEK